MKAVVYHRYGATDMLEVAEIAEPKVPQNSILVTMRAASVNPADLVLRAGYGAAFMDAWFPVVPGWDAAGIVERVGAGVSEFAVGDEVIGYLHNDLLHAGTYAEKVAGPADRFVKKPATLDWSEAAALPLAGLTAWQVIAALKLQAGETLLVHGASGGVGSMAVQLALALGARVIGSASEKNHAFLRSLGVEPVLYGATLREQLIALAPNGVDAVLDCFGRGVLAATSAVGHSATRSVSIADAGPGITTVFVRPNHDDLQRVAALAGQGKLTIRIAATFPLKHAALAQQALEKNSAGGKIVLEI